MFAFWNTACDSCLMLVYAELHCAVLRCTCMCTAYAVSQQERLIIPKISDIITHSLLRYLRCKSCLSQQACSERHGLAY